MSFGRAHQGNLGHRMARVIAVKWRFVHFFFGKAVDASTVADFAFRLRALSIVGVSAEYGLDPRSDTIVRGNHEFLTDTRRPKEPTGV
jgi:hypothetical protein